jgi:hypothetical protein
MAPIDGVLNLWVGAVDHPAQVRALTRVADRDLGPWIVWLHNNRHVVFFRDQGGDENWQAHRVDVDTGDVLALTPAPGVKSYIQQTSRHFPDELLIAHNQRDPRYSDLFRLNVATGTSTLLLANDRFAWLFTDPRFRVRFGVRQTDDGATEYLQLGPGGDWAASPTRCASRFMAPATVAIRRWWGQPSRRKSSPVPSISSGSRIS